MRARASRARAPLAPLAAAAALLLSACTVDVDGAPCAVPGTTADCPDGQACGNDLRCSARALACVSTSSRCTPDATYCSSTRTATAVRCERADPVCGTWVEDDCGARGMECGTRGSGACECPEYAGTVVVADPRGSPSRSVFPYPRGQAVPRECSYGRLADALLAVSTGPLSAVEIAGDAGRPAVFGVATAEAWPVLVPSNVTLRAASPGTDPVIRAGPDPASPGTLVRVLGTVEGVRVEGGGARGVGVELGCGAPAGPTLRDVVVLGGGSLDPSGAVTAGLRTGVSVRTAACASRLVRVAVTGVAGPALAVEAGTPNVTGGSFGGSEIGIWLRGGSATFSPDGATSVSVTGNAGVGIAIGNGPDAAAPRATVPGANVDRAVITGNGDVGVLVSRLVEPGSSVRLTRCDVAGNGRTRVRTVGSGSGPPPRQVGGVLLSLWDPVTLGSFAGNRLWSNAGDQLVIESDATSWVIGPTACGADTNLFACVDAGAWALRIFGAGSVTAPNDRWPGPTGFWWDGYIGPGVAVPPNKYCIGGPSEPAWPTCLP